MDEMIKTPSTHPDHHVVGKYFAASVFDSVEPQVYLCVAYDSRVDYVMESVTGMYRRREVSPRAINATFSPVVSFRDKWSVPAWSAAIPKDTQDDSLFEPVKPDHVIRAGDRMRPAAEIISMSDAKDKDWEAVHPKDTGRPVTAYERIAEVQTRKEKA